MNPCPCGYLLSRVRSCRCSDLEIARYRNRLSEPFMDRIDLYVSMQDITPEDSGSVTSKALHTKVLEAFSRQIMRGQRHLNGRLDEVEIERFCQLSQDASSVLDQAIARYGLSLRAVGKVRKLARTIADIDNSDTIEKSHLLEALGFRRR